MAERLDDPRPYNIQERAFQFAVQVVGLVRTFPRTLDGAEVGRQLIRAGTAIGANMEEADGAESRRDFIHKARIARKEARETRYWLKLCLSTTIGDPVSARALYREADELVRILSSIIAKASANQTS